MERLKLPKPCRIVSDSAFNLSGGYMQKWEYRQVHGGLTDSQLNDLGAQGWELVGFAFDNTEYRYVFKRPA
jgi:hypothetical protein